MRSPGEGSLYFRKSTGRWYAEVTIGYDIDGKRIAWRFSSKLKREALAAMQARISEKAASAPIPTSERQLSDFLSEWLESVRTTRELRTYLGYKSLVAQHITPALGHHRLVDLRAQHIQALLADLSDTLSPTTVLHVHRCLHRALEVALRWELIDRNPAHVVDAPRIQKREQTWLDLDAARRFIAAARSDPYYAYWLVSLSTGMRRGELLALTWADLDGDVLRVQKALSYVKGAGWVVKDTKTHRSRAVSLIPEVVAALREHRVRQAEQRLAAGPRWHDAGRIFTTRHGTPLDTDSLYDRNFLPILERAGLPRMRMYDLRHSFVSLMLSQGVPVRVVSEMVGHANASQTLGTYAHVSQAMQTEAMAKLGQLLAE